MKRTGVSKKTNKQYTYYCCEHLNSKIEAKRCDFMTWDVPVKDDCPVCGWTMFKLSGRGFKRPFCIDPDCPNFLPEDKRGGYKKRSDTAGEDGKEVSEEKAAEDGSAPKKRTTKKTASSGTAQKKTATAKKATTKKSAATKKTTAKKTTTKKTAKKAEE